MPLPDYRIAEWARDGGVKPFIEENVNPASLDLSVGNLWRDFDDADKLIVADRITIYPKSFLLDVYNLIAKLFRLERKPTAVLGITREWINIPNGMAAKIKLKSTPIREGLSYPIADWVDPGYSGHLTLMLMANRKITLHRGQRVVQVVLEEMEKCKVPYYFKGHYNNQEFPTMSWRRNGNE